VVPAFSQAVDPALFQELKWRSIGPFRGGRTRALAGVPSQPNVFYVGVVNGGVWKTTDYGRIWNPIFDQQPTGSIGAVAIAPSNPDILYVGSGEGLHRPDLSTGDGIYKSTDAGRTWTHLGLRDGQQIPRLSVDPTNPDRLFAAVLGHPYGPNSERGVFRSLNGGQTFEKVLFKDEDTGASFVEIDPSNPNIVYAALWEARQGPWENGAWSGTGGGIFKSTDGGTTWRQLTKGLPADGVVQANIAIAPSQTSRLFATVASRATVELYRSDDAGENWLKVTADPRPAGRIGGGDAPVPAFDPQNPETVYIASTVCWKSTDGGRTWAAFRGAPGGDDYQNIWINPRNPQTILLAADQGAIITVNGGQSWSSWYNQPTAQMYHVTADNAFPYRVCGGQQESGSACVSTRGNDGAISFRDWRHVGAEEYGYVAPDPLDPDIVYGGKLTRHDRRTGQTQHILPKPLRDGGFRVLRTAPVIFSPLDPKALYFGANTLWKTRDGGQTWKEISPDLSRKTFDVPANIGKYRNTPTAQPTQRGVIYTVAPSPVEVNRIWAGTDDGLIHLTVDGGATWKNVTPPQVGPFAKVSLIEAGHFSAGTAYAAINTLRLDDMRPHILRTHDGGATWTEIVTGMDDNAPVNVVREDPKRKGLLYAGTERTVFVSFDDGAHWQTLRQNLPATSIRDLIVKDDDLAVGTHGRGFWILDNVTPLRQMAASGSTSTTTLFAPATAIRVRWNMNTDTPLPPDEPVGTNPPDGAMIDYSLAAGTTGPVTLEIVDRAGQLVRRYSSADPVESIDPQLAIPPYWVRPARPLSATAGMHRFLWDMRYAPIAGAPKTYPIAAIFADTAPTPTSPLVMPGQYTVKLTAAGKTYTQPLTVKMDPRVKTSALDLTAQFTLSKGLYEDLQKGYAAIAEIRTWRAKPGLAADLSQQAEKLLGAGRGGRGAPAGPDTISSVSASLGTLLQLAQEADAAPPSALRASVTARRQALAALLADWSKLKLLAP
jgi:photosystem II stability/assembly factor-like uncharacterized protein